MAAISKGIDEAWSRVDPSILKSLGYTFVIGYVSEDTTGKNLTLDEIDAAHAQNIAVGLVYEFNPKSALGGWNQGLVDAGIAVAAASSLRAPADIALYFAVDWDVTDSQKSAVLQYLRAAKSYCSTAGYRCGVYAGYWVCKYLVDNGWDGFLWQTYAWSGGNWHSNAVLRQVQNGVSISGHDVDINEQWAIDWGQWTTNGGTAMTVSPTDTRIKILTEGWTGDRADWIAAQGDPAQIDALTGAGPLGGSPAIPNQLGLQVKEILQLVQSLNTAVDVLTKAVSTLSSMGLTDAQMNALIQALTTAVSGAVPKSGTWTA